MPDLVFHYVLKIAVVTNRDLGLVTVMAHVTPTALPPEELQVSLLIGSLHKADTRLALPHFHGLLD